MQNLSAIIYGILAAATALVAEVLVSLFFPALSFPNDGTFATLLPILIFATIEEVSKGALIWKMFSQQKYSKKIALETFLLGTGFFGVELYLNLLKDPTLNLFSFSVEGLWAIHAFTAMLWGAMLAQHIFSFQKIFIPALAITVFFHFSYNFSVWTQNFQLPALLLGISILIWLFVTKKYLPNKNKSLPKKSECIII